MNQPKDYKKIALIGAGLAAIILIVILIAYMLSSSPITTKDECENAAKDYLQSIGKIPVRPIQVGHWNHLGPGCSVQSGGDWTIHWNTDPAGVDNANYYTAV